MRYTCPICKGTGASEGDPESSCQTCFGRAVVLTHVEICSKCDGEKGVFCTLCKGARLLYTHEPFTFPVREVTVDQVHRALRALKAGPLLPESDEIDPFALGVTSALITFSEDRRERLGWDPGELFRGLDSAGVIRFADSGIWYFPDPTQPAGVQLVRHPVADEAQTAR